MTKTKIFNKYRLPIRFICDECFLENLCVVIHNMNSGINYYLCKKCFLKELY